MPNPYKKHYPGPGYNENPRRYMEVPSTGTRGNVKKGHLQATLRGPMLGPDRRSKKNRYHTDLAVFHRGKGGTRRRRGRGTRRR